MTKNEFKKLLNQRIQVLETQERERILNFYEETIDDSIEDGCSEEEAVSKLGDLEMIVNDIFAENHIVKPQTSIQRESPIKKNRMYVLLFLIITSPLWLALGTAGLTLLLCAYILVGCGYLMLTLITIVPVGVVIASLIVLPFHIFRNIPYSMLVFGITLISTGLSFNILPNIKAWWLWLTQKTISYSVQGYRALRERLVF